jgi:hypothetical protein
MRATTTTPNAGKGPYWRGALGPSSPPGDWSHQGSVARTAGSYIAQSKAGGSESRIQSP